MARRRVSISAAVSMPMPAKRSTDSHSATSGGATASIGSTKKKRAAPVESPVARYPLPRSKRKAAARIAGKKAI
jgi:ethanolamine ammonia-lyase small subunit